MPMNPFYKKLATLSIAIGLLVFGFQNCSRPPESNTASGRLPPFH